MHPTKIKFFGNVYFGLWYASFALPLSVLMLLDFEIVLPTYCDMQTRSWPTALKRVAIQQPLQSNGSTNKHVSTVMRREYSNNGRDVFYAVCALML
jgi:hypothetical protein